MKRGRPKDIGQAKNRIHSVLLSIKAEKIYREITKKRFDTKWFSSFVNQHLINDFGEKFAEALALYELNELTNKRNNYDEMIKDKAKEICNLRKPIISAKIQERFDQVDLEQ